MATLRSIDKRMFLSARTCRTLGWYLRRDATRSSPGAADLMRMREGQEIGRRAQLQFPRGVLVVSGTKDAVTRTSELASDPANAILFEASFVFQHFVAKADIIEREGEGWHLIEVKASLNPKDELVEDLAYTAFVMDAAGHKIIKASLMILSKDYRKGMADGALFAPLIDKTDEVRALMQVFGADAESLSATTAGDARPQPALTKACKDCEHFHPDCFGVPQELHPISLPYLSDKKLAEIAAAGAERISDIPDSIKLSDSHEVIRRANRLEQVVTDKATVAEVLDQVQWPAGYLDFETVTTAIPLYDGIAPFQQVPTQYSLHVLDGVGAPPKHFEYLAEPSKDCRAALAAKLIADSTGAKSIIVYSSFEKTTLKGLRDTVPSLAEALQELIERLVDLEPALKPGAFYDRRFGGRSSIKVTLPVLVPELSYKDLSIADGGAAIAAFADMALGRTPSDQIHSVRANLFAYCKLDTLAMVKLHGELIRRAE